MSKDTGGNAIPLGGCLTVRDYFAAQVMGDMLLMFGLDEDYDDMAINAYAYADAMIAERNKA